MIFRRILTPVDFSEASREAVAWGATLAHRLEAQLTLLHVLDLPDRDGRYFEGPSDADKAVQADLLEAARAKLRTELEAVPAAEGLDVLVRARAGSPAREILGEVREAGMDLVVLATHGRRGLAHALLGSVAEKLVRTCPCPVLTLKASEPAMAGQPAMAGESGDVLFATDLSPASQAALGPAIELASRLGGTLTALHVLEEPHLSIGRFEDVFGMSAEQMQRRFETRARAAIREEVEEALPEGLPFHVKLLGGSPHEEIVREAAKGTHDLIVMGTRGRSNLGEALLGSTAERVVRTSTVPVLTVRSEA